MSSPAFTPKLAGTYRWVVSYSGDANNAAVAGGCNDVGESTVVSKATPKLATAASPTITLGSGVLTDAATVSGLVSPQASATIDFRLYGPRDPTCAAAPVFQSLGIRLPVSGGRVTTAAFTPTAAGTSRWVASYSGDANNAPMAGACNAPGETAVVAVTAAPTQLSHLKCYGARKAGFAPKSVLLRDQFMQTRSVVTKVTQIWNPVRKNGGKIVHSRTHLVCYATHDVGSAHFRPRSVRVTNQFGVRDLAVLAPVSLCVPSLKRKGTAPPRGKLLASALDHFRCYSVKPQQTPKVVKLADEFGVTSTKVIDVVRLCNPVRKNKGPAPARPKAHLVCSLQGRLRGQDCREPVRRLEARGVRNHPAPNCLDPRHLAHTGDELLRSELPVEEIPPDSGVQQVHGLLLVVGPADREDGDVRRQRPA